MNKIDLSDCVTMKMIDGASIMKRQGTVPPLHCRYVIEYLGYALREFSKYNLCVDWLKEQREAAACTTATITDAGDPSVGIQAGQSFVRLPFNVDEVFERADLRVSLKNFFEPLHDGKVCVLFGDECPDCGALGYRFNLCANVKGCPSHRPADEI